MNTLHGPSRLRRAALLIAALLHVVAAVAGPALHAWSAAGPSQVVVAADRETGSPAAAHDELTCTVCQAANALVLPEPGIAPVPADEASLRAHAAPSPPAAASPRIRLRARAPPAPYA